MQRYAIAGLPDLQFLNRCLAGLPCVVDAGRVRRVTVSMGLMSLLEGGAIGVEVEGLEVSVASAADKDLQFYDAWESAAPCEDATLAASIHQIADNLAADFEMGEFVATPEVRSTIEESARSGVDLLEFAISSLIASMTCTLSDTRIAVGGLQRTHNVLLAIPTLQISQTQERTLSVIAADGGSCTINDGTSTDFAVCRGPIELFFQILSDTFSCRALMSRVFARFNPATLSIFKEFSNQYRDDSGHAKDNGTSVDYLVELSDVTVRVLGVSTPGTLTVTLSNLKVAGAGTYNTTQVFWEGLLVHEGADDSAAETCSAEDPALNDRLASSTGAVPERSSPPAPLPCELAKISTGTVSRQVANSQAVWRVTSSEAFVRRPSEDLVALWGEFWSEWEREAVRAKQQDLPSILKVSVLAATLGGFFGLDSQYVCAGLSIYAAELRWGVWRPLLTPDRLPFTPSRRVS